MVEAIKTYFEEGAPLTQTKGVWQLGEQQFDAFEQRYLAVRQAEGRVLTDEQVRLLPTSPHPKFSNEWRVREQAMNRVGQLKLNGKKVLDVGCGNGWFSHFLLGNAMKVIGLDVNRVELEQAARVFDAPGVSFLQANLFDPQWKKGRFDQVFFNSSIQYFPNLTQTINRAMELLVERGSIHILDSPFYAQSKVKEAIQRSRDYYRQLGFPEMSDHYGHHTLEEIASFKPHFRYRPVKGFFNRFKSADSPFPWIEIRNAEG